MPQHNFENFGFDPVEGRIAGSSVRVASIAESGIVGLVEVESFLAAVTRSGDFQIVEEQHQVHWLSLHVDNDGAEEVIVLMVMSDETAD